MRKSVRQKLLAMGDKPGKDQAIIRQLNQIVSGKSVLLVYLADQLEVDLSSFFQNHQEIQFFFPRINPNSEMEFVLPDAWEIGPFSMAQPASGERIEPEFAELCIIPSLGYNEKGFRLGRGSGFYDRFLSRVKSDKIIGLTYESLFPLQFIGETHDISAGTVITEKRIRHFFHNS